jgi:transcriptional regulator with XRE-family HTH domain
LRLREFLQVTATPQAKFAELIGVRQPTISRYLSGKIPPSAAAMARIRDASQGAVAVADWVPLKKPRRRVAPA